METTEIDVEPPAKKSKLEEPPNSDESLCGTSMDKGVSTAESCTLRLNPPDDKPENGNGHSEVIFPEMANQNETEGSKRTSTKCVVASAEDLKEHVPDNSSVAVPSSSPALRKPLTTRGTKGSKRPLPVTAKSKKKKKRKRLKLSPSQEAKSLVDQASAKRKAANLRKNIKDILKTESLGEETLAAQREEAERRERTHLKLQQLKFIRDQKAAAEAAMSAASISSILTPSVITNDATIVDDAHQIQPVVVDGISTNSRLIPLEVPFSDNDSGPVVSKEEIVLLSSDDDEEKTEKASESIPFSAFHQQSSQSQQPYATPELRSHVISTHPLFPYPNSESVIRATSSNNYAPYIDQPQDHNIISISSGEEDNSNCDKEVTNALANGNGHPSSVYFKNSEMLIQKNVRGDNNESDDDCIVVSPTPDNDDMDKDERNLDELNVPDVEGKVLVNVGHPDEDPDIFLAPQVAKIVKPHQIGGIRFLYDNVVESIDRFNTASGFGCILAHSMGLGKTLQAVSFCDVFLRASNAKTVLIIVPINTIQNWLNEFNVWLPTKKSEAKKKKKPKNANIPPKNSPNSNSLTSLSDSISETVSLNLSFDSTLNLLEGNNDDTESKETKPESEPEDDVLGEVHPRSFEVYVLNETVKTLSAREKIIADWATKGGVMLMGYEMYRMLALKKLKKSSKKQQPNFFNGIDDVSNSNEALSLNNIHTCLVDPGPDLVICDEGHRIKNSGASISQALKAIRTRRRLVLTGYPLQNNLMEYWCMVDFIRPNYLGSKVEFSNMFERPISNGQCVDSTPEDRKLMRFRSHVLHSLLEGFVQRRSHAVLHSALPMKQEWVFLLKMTTVQYNLYKEFMAYLSDNLDGQCGANPIKAFAVCCKIWNHPDALYNVVRRKQSILDDLDLDEINGGSSSSESNRSRGCGRRGRKEKTEKAMFPQNQISFFDGSGFDFRKSASSYASSTSTNKSGSEGLSLEWALPIFQNYVPGVLENGVKFEILFEIIKESLAVKDKLLVFSQTLLSLDLVESFFQQKFNWTKNAQYYRLDGSTTGLEREKLINNFNALEGVFVFLVSTRAGSLGINLTGANRVVVLDASWNPCHDCQAVCRIYRYGQTKPCQIYRFVSDCTLEKRIYDRQINKRGMSDRVVDEMNPNAQFKSKDVSSFLVLKHDHLDKLQYIKCELHPEKYSDPILQNVLVRHGDKMTQEPFEHESLLIDQKSQRLSATEKRLAHRNYLNEKRTAELQSASGYSYSRPSYAAYYPRESPGSSSNSHSQRASFLNTSNFRSGALEDKFEHHVSALRAKGICVQSIVLKKDSFLADPSGGPDMYLMAGEKIYVLRSEKGTYLRISNGKLIAVRNNPSNSRFSILTVPPTQELMKDQLLALVYSFLKLPGHSSSYIDYDSRSLPYGSQNSYPIHPSEQPLPPSASFFSQSKNHLQVTNTRSNSGGDVTMWQPQGVQSQTTCSNLVRSSPPSKHSNSDFSKPQSLSALLDSNNGSGSPNFNSSLEKLSYLARFSSITNPRKDESSRRSSSRVSMMCMNDNNDSSNSSSGFPTGFLFPSQCPPTNTNVNPLFDSGSAPSTTMEVIPISKKNKNEISSTSTSTLNAPAPSYPYSPSVSISTTPRSHVEIERQSKSNDANPSSFYEDFTITVKAPKPNNSVGSASGNTMGDFVPGTHFNFDRGEYLAGDQPNVSSNNNNAATNIYEGAAAGINATAVHDVGNFNQYYNSNLVQRNIHSNGNSNSSSSSKNDYPFFPNQGV